MDRFKHTTHKFGKAKPPANIIRQIVLENKKCELCNKDLNEDDCHKKNDKK